MTLETPRLRLEELRPEHAENLFLGLADPELYAYLDEKPPLTVEELRIRYQHQVANRHKGWLNWAILHKQEQTYIGYAQATLGPRQEADLACVLFRPYWKAGYAQELAFALMHELRQHYAVTTFRAQADARNAASLRLMDRLGFEKAPTPPDVPGDRRFVLRD